MMRLPLFFALALSSIALVACGAPSEDDAGLVEGAASTGNDNDDRTAGGFDVRGKLTPGEQFSYAFKKDNISVLAFDATPDAAVDVAVVTGTDGAQVHIDIHGPFDATTGKFGPLVARGEIQNNARVRDLKVPTAGIYMILASELGNSTADYTALVQSSATPRMHTTVTEQLFGPKVVGDDAQRRAGFNAACADWKKRMFDLSANHIDFISCGTPSAGFGSDATHLESTGTIVVAAKLEAGDATTAVIDPADTLPPSGAGLSAGAVDEYPAAKWVNACFGRLNDLKTKFPTRFVVGTCPRTVALGVRAGDAWVETWSGSVRGVYRR